MSATPRWATARTPDRKTLGTVAWKMSRVINQTLMPWQREVLDVAMEVRDDGRFAYRNVTLTIPRQNGKTTALLAMVLARAILDPGTRIAYCAQSALDARKKWREDWQPAIAASPLVNMVRFSWAPGDERMDFANGSQASIVAGTKQSAHGKTDLDLAVIDEAFAYKDSRLEQALRPAMMHEPNAQIWIVSTAGTPLESPYLWDKVKSGRKFVDQGATSGTCYFEWSAHEDDPAGSPDTWRACMPALDLELTEEVIKQDYDSLLQEGKLSEFKRAYLNLWTATLGEPIVSADHWQALGKPDAPRPPWAVLGLDVGPRGTGASIVAVGESQTPEGQPALQSTVVESGEGVAWLLDALRSQVTRWDRPYVVVDGKATAHMLPELERVVGFDRLRVLGASDIPPACSFWLGLAQRSRLYHRGEPELTNALIGAAQRTINGLDGWAWTRAKSGVDITSLVAQTLACSFWLGAWRED